MNNDDNFARNLRCKLQELRMAHKHTDVTLISIDKTPFKAHKVVLAVRSSYFDRLFGEMSEKKPSVDTVIRTNLDTATLQSVLDFIYLDKQAIIQVSSLEQARTLYLVADKLELKLLVKSVSVAVSYHMAYEQTKFIQASLSVYFRARAAKRASINGVSDQLPYESKKSIQASLSQYYNAKVAKAARDSDLRNDQDDDDSHILAYDFQQVSKLVEKSCRAISTKLKEIMCREGEKVAQDVVLWVKHQPQDRQAHMAPLFAKLPVKFFSKDFIKDLFKEESVTSDPQMLKLLAKNIN